MSVSIVANFYYGENTLVNFITNEISLQKGFYSINFSEMNTLSESIILSGSCLEVDGDLYQFNSNETIGGTPSGICFIKCYTSSSYLIAEYTTVEPEYNVLKSGWYGTSAASSHRYVMKLYYNNPDYSNKQIMNKERYYRNDS